MKFELLSLLAPGVRFVPAMIVIPGIVSYKLYGRIDNDGVQAFNIRRAR